MTHEPASATTLDGEPAAARHALYWVPARDHPLWRAGCRWLGRDPEGHEAGPPPPPHAHAPWRYGFHATLKPPMRLRAGASEEEWVDAVRALAIRFDRFPMPALQVAWLGGFLAIRPVSPIDAAHPLRRLADACVEHLDAWRRAPTPAERDGRAAGVADPQQIAYALRWGYPYVFDAWRFHLTLSDAEPSDAESLERRAREHFAAALAAPLACAEVALFREDRRGAALRLTHRLPLRAP